MRVAPSNILRIILVFSLTFMVSWHVEYELAYGAGSTGVPSERSAATTEKPTSSAGDSQPNGNTGTGAENSGTAPDSPGDSADASKQENGQGSSGDGSQDGNTQPSQPEQPASYAYVKTIEILVLDKEDNRVGHTEDPLEVEVNKDGKGTYEFHAKVVWVPDSNNPEDTKEVICTPKENLSKKTGGALNDLVWEIFVPTKNDKGEIQEEKIPTSQAQFKKDLPGMLEVYALDLAFSLRVYSGEGQGWAQTESRFVPDVLTITTVEEKPEDENESSSSDEDPVVAAYTIYYDANGATGEAIEPSQSDAEGNVILAENTFVAPEGKEFGGWNTHADGTGTLFAAGSTISSEQVVAALQDKQNEDAGNLAEDTESNSEGSIDSSAETSSASTDLSSEGVLSLTLYAIWAEPGSADSGEMTGNALVRLSYIPAPLGQNATLSPVLSNVGHITFAYVWELSTDGGASWEYAPNDNIQTMLVPTTEETIGWQYRVSVYADRTINPDDGSNKITSEPVTIREANENDFTIVLSFEPVVEGDMAHFSVTSSDLDVTYEWLESTDGGASWKTITGVTTPSYSIPTDESHMGNWYRVKAKRPGAGTKNTCDDGTEGDECACDPDVACSNVQMLVALAPDAEPIVIDDVTGYDPTSPEDDSDSKPNDDTESTPSDPDTNTDPDTSSSEQDNNTPIAENTDPPAPASPTEPSPAPEQQPSEFEPVPNQPTEANASELTPIDNVIVDPEVSEKLMGEIAEQESTQTPGSHWRKLSVIPQQEEIQAVLEENPFAPLVIPLTIALIACGMTERLLFFRRQTKDTGAAFT